MTTSDYPAGRLGRPAAGGSLSLGSIRALSAEAWVVCLLVVVAAVIRFLVIDNQSYWTDEALTAYEARISFGSMLGVVLHVETTPPLYFVLIWAWGHLFGTSEVALRSVSALAGIAVVPIAYLCGKELASRRAGVLASAFVALNPFLIWYSQEARAYMLLVAFSGASFLWFVRARRDPSRRNLAWWAAWSSLALMTHFFAGFLVAIEALWLLWVARTRVATAAVGVVAAVEVAMLPFAVLDTSHGAGWIGAEPRVNRVSQAISEWGLSILYRRTPIAWGLIGGAALVIVVAALTALGGARRTREAVGAAAAVAAFVWLVPLALGVLSPAHDYFISRNLMPAVVPVAVLIAAACVAPRTHLLGGALAAALLAMFAVAAVRVQSRPYLERPDWRAVAHALGPATVPRAILAANGTTADPLKIYLQGVHWSEPYGRRWLIYEVDVVGATKRLSLLPEHPTDIRTLRGRHRGPVGRPVPRSTAPPGMRLLARFKLDNWVLARFALRRPLRITLPGLRALAPRVFRRTPVKLLAFFEPPQR